MCLLLLFHFTDKDISLTYYLPFSFKPIPIKLSLKIPKRKPFLPMSQKTFPWKIQYELQIHFLVVLSAALIIQYFWKLSFNSFQGQHILIQLTYSLFLQPTLFICSSSYLQPFNFEMVTVQFGITFVLYSQLLTWVQSLVLCM